jgi:hypothetical protein
MAHPTTDLNELLAVQARANGSGSIRSVRMRGTLREGTDDIPGFTVTQARPHLLRVGVGNFAEGYDGTTAWEKPGSQEHGAPVSGAPAAALWRAARWPGLTRSLLDCRNDGHRVEWLRSDDGEGQACHVLQVTLTDDFTREYWLDVRTCLIVRSRDFRPLHPGQPPEVIEDTLDDFRPLAGMPSINVAFRSTGRRTSDGAVLSVLQWDSIEVNPDLPDAYFQVP